jgi:catechol 2,3-dioxygenase-like lactoylglutathione lyase family enzyme
MFSHVTVGTNDVERAKKFYDAVFGALGVKEGVNFGAGVAYSHEGRNFIVRQPVNGEAASFANGGTIGFMMASPEQADTWHAAGTASGGASCEDPPGLREGSNLYLAYLRDPDGNKLCGMFPMPR